MSIGVTNGANVRRPCPAQHPVTVEKRLNPEAVRFFKRHGEDIL